jgi:hypothetical protein
MPELYFGALHFIACCSGRKVIPLFKVLFLLPNQGNLIERLQVFPDNGVLYFRNTSEDHEYGAYEGYLNEMNDHAEDVKIFLNPDETEILEWYLKGLKR